MQFGPDASKEVALPRDAATVLLLRGAPDGFEVFLVKRSGLSDVLGEAHVFPGGKVDAADSSAAMLARVYGVAQLDVAALARWESGGIKLAPPTYMSLQHLAQYASIESLLADARSQQPPVLQPVTFEDGGVRCLALPGDALHPQSRQAIPGPTRLAWDGVKYAPAK